MARTLKVAAREETGSLRMKRMRQAGHVPAVLYGGGGDNVLLAVPSVELGKIIVTGDRQVQLEGSVNGPASIKSVQYDTFGVDVLHVDLIRA